MKVKFVGFGGYMEVPCYEDENGKLYFDENNGRNGLDLYTGAYKKNGGKYVANQIQELQKKLNVTSHS